MLKHMSSLWISAGGVPVFSVLGAGWTHEFFGGPWLLAFSLPLIFVLAVSAPTRGNTRGTTDPLRRSRSSGGAITAQSGQQPIPRG